jgi:hypothetical protein
LFCEGDDLVERVVRQQNAGVFGIVSEPNNLAVKCDLEDLEVEVVLFVQVWSRDIDMVPEIIFLMLANSTYAGCKARRTTW